MHSKRIYLSSPHLGTEELELVHEAFASNWIAPLGPHVVSVAVPNVPDGAKVLGVPARSR